MAAAVESAQPVPDAATWVRNVKIGAVRAGNPPRVLLDRRTVVPGDLVQAEFGIVFESYDAERRLLRFKDASGASYERRER